MARLYERGHLRTDRGLFIDKGNFCINVLHGDFGNSGAKGDGVTDDTLAIQDAVDFAITHGFREIYFPDGTYLTSGINVHGAPLVFSGAGRDVTTIKLLAGSTGNLIDFDTGVSVFDIHLHDNGITTSRSDNGLVHCTSASFVGPLIVKRCKLSLCTEGIWLDDPDQETVGDDDSKDPVLIEIEDNEFTWSKAIEEFGYCVSIVGYASFKVNNNRCEGVSVRNCFRFYASWENGVGDGRNNGVGRVCGNQFISSNNTGLDNEAVGIYYKGSHSIIEDNRFYEWGGRCIDVQGVDSEVYVSKGHSVRNNRIMYKDGTGTILHTIEIGTCILFRAASGIIENNIINTGTSTANRTHGIEAKWGCNQLDIRGNDIRSSGSCIHILGVNSELANTSTSGHITIHNNELDSYRNTSDGCIWLEAGSGSTATDIDRVEIINNECKGAACGMKFGVSSADREARIRGVTILRNKVANSTAFQFNTFPYFEEVDDIGTPTFTCDTAGDGDHESTTLADALLRLPHTFRGLNDSTITLDVKGTHAGGTKIYNYDGALFFTDSATGAVVNTRLALTNLGRGLTTITGLDGDTSAATGSSIANFRLSTGRFDLVSLTCTAGGTVGSHGVQATLGAWVNLTTVTINNALSEAILISGGSTVVVTTLAGSGNTERADVQSGSTLRVRSSTLTTATDTVQAGSNVI